MAITLKTKQQVPVEVNWENTKQIWHSLGNLRWHAFFLTLLIVLGAFTESLGFAMILPILDVILNNQTNSFWSQAIYTHLLANIPTQSHLLAATGIFLALILVKNFIFILRVWYSSWFCFTLGKVNMTQVLKAYNWLPYARVLGEKQGDLINNVMNEPRQAMGAVFNIIELTARVFLSISLYAVLLKTNANATLIISILALLLIFLTNKTGKSFALRFGQQRLRLSQICTTIASEALIGAREIRTFNLRNLIYSNFYNNAEKMAQVHTRYKIFSNLPICLGDILLTFSGIGGILYVHYVLGISLKGSVPTIGLFVMVGRKLMSITTEIVQQRIHTFSNLPSLYVVNSFINTKSTEKPKYNFPIKKIDADIIFKDVDFSYNVKSNQQANIPLLFDKLNLVIPQRKMTALVGPSGVGKSTIAELLLRLHRPVGGQILLGNEDINKFDIDAWRERIGYVSQDTFVFHTSIRENILFGNLNASEDQVIQAAKAACAHEFIQDLYDGYDSVVGERGLQLSGGQRQRLALARAIIRDPDLLIFDEATSALDHQTEIAVQESIDSFLGRKTILIIAHRLSTIEKADVVYDLSKISSIRSVSFPKAVATSASV